MRLLLLEDSEDDVLLVRKRLTGVSGMEWDLTTAGTLREALEHLERSSFDLVIADLSLPDSQGLETFLRVQAKAKAIPVIVLTGTYANEDENEELALKALRNGAQDYLIKEDLAGSSLVRAIRHAIERKRMERRMLEALAVKSEFTSMVSHEFRTPLTVIKEGIGIVSDQSSGPLNPAQIDYLQTAQRNVDRLARLINDVLDFQRLETGEVEAHLTDQDINALVQESLKDLEALAQKKRLRLVTELAEGLPKISLDKDRIIQVLVNLVSNAVKFTEAGKGISVRTKRQDNVIRIDIQDEGIGIKAEDLPKLFQSFSQIPVQGTRRAGGSGLGLAISKKIVEMHQGKIGVGSVYGKGSTFFFLLPISERRGRV